MLTSLVIIAMLRFWFIDTSRILTITVDLKIRMFFSRFNLDLACISPLFEPV